MISPAASALCYLEKLTPQNIEDLMSTISASEDAKFILSINGINKRNYIPLEKYLDKLVYLIDQPEHAADIIKYLPQYSDYLTSIIVGKKKSTKFKPYDKVIFWNGFDIKEGCIYRLIQSNVFRVFSIENSARFDDVHESYIVFYDQKPKYKVDDLVYAAENFGTIKKIIIKNNQWHYEVNGVLYSEDQISPKLPKYKEGDRVKFIVRFVTAPPKSYIGEVVKNIEWDPSIEQFGYYCKHMNIDWFVLEEDMIPCEVGKRISFMWNGVKKYGEITKLDEDIIVSETTKSTPSYCSFCSYSISPDQICGAA